MCKIQYFDFERIEEDNGSLYITSKDMRMILIIAYIIKKNMKISMNYKVKMGQV